MNDYTPIADLYDLYVTDTRDHAFWTRRATESPGPLLELTAGTGRATVALRAGTTHPVVALDCSPAMLCRLASRLASEPLPVHAVCGDLVALPFPDGSFASAVIPFNSLGELVNERDRVASLREVRRVLRPPGRAVVTLHNPARRRLTLDGEPRMLGPFASGDRRLEVAVRGSMTGADVAASEQTYRVFDGGGTVVEERRVTIRFALPDLAALRATAEGAGLRLDRLFGDYDESPFDPSSSPFMLALLERS